MSGMYSKRKGYSFENETVHTLKEAGIDARRQPLSGALFSRELKNDIRANLPSGEVLSIECKRRKKFSDDKLIEQVKKYCDHEIPAVIKRSDRKKPTVLLYVEDFLKLILRCDFNGKK